MSARNFLSPLSSVSNRIQIIIKPQDLLALDPDATAALLRRLFRRKATLKAGYALRADLSSLAHALGAAGPGAVAVMDPVVDVGVLHRRLLHQRCSGVAPSLGGGLAGLVAAQLGAPLDKGEQCSEWERRPLSAGQLRYAATDVCCLVALLRALIGCAREQLKLAPAETSSEAREGAFEWPGGGEAVAAAIGAWGERWESSGNGGKFKRTGGLSHLPLTGAEGGKAKGKGAAAADFAPFPSHLPWLDPQTGRPRPGHEPRFLADVMCHGLARQLRLWGVDAEAVACVAAAERHRVHRALVERAAAEGRVILTRDAIFMRRGLSDSAYFVRQERKRDQLEEVIGAFQLPVAREALLSRCSRCNGEFGEAAVGPGELPPGHGVPDGVVERVPEFWLCRRCGTAYWQGSMYERAMERLGAAMESMSVGR